MDEWINKMWYVHHGIVFSLKSNEVLTGATPWMYPEEIMLREMIQVQKEGCYIIPLMLNIWNK